jgi:N-acetylmuramoyl-L-alanine amidase CwlA
VRYTDPDGFITIQVALLPLTPNTGSRPGWAITEHRAVVMHWTGSPGQSAMQTRNYFVTSGTSAHYIIGQSGEIVQAVPDDEFACHAGISTENPVYSDLAQELFTRPNGVISPNRYTLGIEVNPRNLAGDYTKSAYRSSVQLAAKLIKDNNIGGFFSILFGTSLLRHSDLTGRIVNGEFVGKVFPKKFYNNDFGWFVFKVQVAFEYLRYSIFGE